MLGGGSNLTQTLKMLFALRWRLNPPTPLAFCRLFLDFLEDEHNFDFIRVNKKVVNDLAIVETGVASLDYKYISSKPSKIAFTSILRALGRSGFNEKEIVNAARTLAKITGVNYKGEVGHDNHDLKDTGMKCCLPESEFSSTTTTRVLWL